MVTTPNPPTPNDQTQFPGPNTSFRPRFTPLKFQGYGGSYGWGAQRTAYDYRDVPLMREDPWNMAYEWFRYSDTSRSKSNPPFSSDAAGRLISTIHARGFESGQAARILRGFIRRAETDAADPLSTGRLYFMYNPTIISRDYVSYLDQGALDPFNTVFQSENLVAPPSMLNFTFELFFDRQDEARDPENPGVLVDMEFFDMVVRNVIPDATLQVMPDNGVMMVNPRDITVVFSPEITVQGRPLNASVVFEKFTHRMIPTRMRIQLTMRVIYWGPQREASSYTAEQGVATARVGYTATTDNTYAFTFAQLESTATGDVINEMIDTQLGFINTANATSTTGAAGSSGALNYAIQQWNANGTKYSKERRDELWTYADCSSLVWGGFNGVNQAATLGWSTKSAPSTWAMHEGFISSTAVQKIWGFDGDTDKNAGCQKMQVGDIIYRVGGGAGDDHVAFVAEATKEHIKVFHAMSTKHGVGYSTTNYPVTSNPDFRYDHGVRPLVLGGQSAATQNNDQSR